MLSLAVDGNVDFLLTGDKDLLILNPHGKTKITNISDFMGNDFEILMNN